MASIILNENPQLNLWMDAMTEDTDGYCDEWNVRHQQLLENDQYLNEEQEKIKAPEFIAADTRENIASKEKLPKILGKIARFFADLKEVAFSGKYGDLSGKPAIVNNNTTTEAGSALDARQANPTIEGTMANQILQLNNDSILSGNLGLGDYETKSMKLKPGFYIFINGHVFSPQITTLIVTADLPLRVDNILQPASGSEVEISETDGVHNKITFSAKGGCRGNLYDMHIYY